MAKKTVIGELATLVTANVRPFVRGLRDASQNATKFSGRVSRSMAAVRSGINSIGGAVIGLTRRFAQLGSAAVVAGIAMSVKMAADMESTAATFRVLLGSANAARGVLKQVEEFAASTPFQFADLADSTRKLVAFGFAGQDAVKFLKNLGEIAAATDTPLTELAELFGKMRVQGRLFGEDMNQILGRGINILPLLAQKFGVATEEVKKLVSEGKVGFADVRWAIEQMTNEGGKFAGVMKERSETVNGLFSTLKDNLAAIMRDIGASLIETFGIKGGLGQGIETLKQMKDDIVPAVVKGITKFALAVVQLGQQAKPYLEFIFDITMEIVGAYQQLASLVGSVLKSITGVGSFGEFKANLVEGYAGIAERLAGMTSSDTEKAFLQDMARAGNAQAMEIRRQNNERQGVRNKGDEVLKKMERHLQQALEFQSRTANATEGIDDGVESAEFAF